MNMNSITKLNYIRKALDRFEELPEFYKIHEPFDRVKLQYCLDNMNDIIRFIDNFSTAGVLDTQEHLIKLKTRKSDWVSYKKNIRYYSIDPSFQSLKKAFRVFITNDDCIDIDAEACHYSLFIWLADMLDVDISTYLELKGFFSKIDIYTLLFGGDTHGYDEASDEVSAVVDTLLERIPELQIHVPENETNWSGKFLSQILCRLEAVVVDDAMTIFKSHNFKIRGLFFDGFFINRRIEHDRVYKSIFKEISIFFKNTYDMDMKFVIKGHFDSNVIQTRVIDSLALLEPEIRLEPYVDYHIYVTKIHRVIIVQAPLKAGKSTSVQTFLRWNKEEFDKIIVICPRISYSNSVIDMFNDHYPFVHYKDTRSKSIRKPFLVVQFESLWRVDVQSYENALLIMDECEATLTQLTSLTTNKKNHSKNIENFEWLLRNSKKVIATDAFMLYSNKMIDMCINMNVSFKIYNYITKPVERKMVQVEHIDIMMKLLIEQLNAGLKIFFFSSSKYRIEKILEELARECPAIRIASYYKNQSSTELKNVRKEWINYDLVICNSVITIGLDFNVEYFDNIFLYVSQKSKNLLRDVAQALYRPRQIRGYLMYCIDKNDKGLQSSAYRALTDWNDKYCKDYVAYYNTLLRSNDLSDSMLNTRTWIKLLFIQNNQECLTDVYDLENSLENVLEYCNYTKLEESHPVYEKIKLYTDECEFEKILGNDNFTFDDIDYDELTRQALIELGEIDDETKGVFKFETIRHLSKEEYNRKVRLITKTSGDLFEIEKYKYLNITNDIRGQYFDFYMEHTGIFWKLLYEFKLHYEHDLCIAGLSGKITETQSPKYRQATAVKHYLQLLEIPTTWGALGYDANISIPIPEKYIERVYKEINTKNKYLGVCDVLGLVPNKKHLVKDIHQTVTFLNNILKSYSISKITKTVKHVKIDKKKSRVYSYYFGIDIDFNPTIYGIHY